jgi:hypothetical protein
MFTQLKEILQTALPKAFKTAIWLLSLMLPISLGVTILQYFGVISWAAGLLNPLFHYLGLSGQCAFVFLTSIFLNIYSAIAVISSLPLTIREITILALMCLISHNMIIETIIQGKTGSSKVKMVFIRLISSIISALLLNYLLPAEALKTVVQQVSQQQPTLWFVVEDWAVKMFILAIKVVVFVSSLMVLQQILEKSGIIEIISKVLAPLLKLMGLPRRTSFLWIVANVLGLAYGAAIMIEELEKEKLNREESNLLNHHIAVSHSLLEDTLLFMTIGVAAFWITIPRILIAIAVVWMYRLSKVIFMKV